MINVEALNPIDNIYENDKTSIINLQELPYYDEQPYDLEDEKSFARYIKNLERVVRNSFEYIRLMTYLRNTEGMHECAVLSNVNSNGDSKIRIEIHHSPFTLYDICATVFRKRSSNHEDLNINAVAEEVIYLHYIAWVGLIPLSATVHDMVHNAYFFIPTNKVRGNYRAFIEAYYNSISPDLLDAIDAAEQATKDDIARQRMELFNNHRMYVNVNGSYQMPQKNQIRTQIKDHISSLKGNTEKKVMCTIVSKT